jgi:hypothetical protein
MKARVAISKWFTSSFYVLQIKYIGFSGLPLDAFTYILDRCGIPVAHQS